MLNKLFFVLSLFFIGESFADYKEGLTAFEKGDYVQAQHLWLKVLESEGKDRDHSQKSDALYGLGQIYWFGNQEIKQDYRKAAEWFEKAAISGNGDAQLILGGYVFSRAG